MKALRAALTRELDSADLVLTVLWLGSVVEVAFCIFYVFPQALAS